MDKLAQKMKANSRKNKTKKKKIKEIKEKEYKILRVPDFYISENMLRNELIFPQRTMTGNQKRDRI